MKKFMPVILVALMGLFFINSFVGCKEEQLPPTAEEIIPKEDNAPAQERNSP